MVTLPSLINFSASLLEHIPDELMYLFKFVVGCFLASKMKKILTKVSIRL
jgi:hypothetical protein